MIVGQHHLNRLAPTQLQHMQDRLQILLQESAARAGEEAFYEEASRHGGVTRQELSLHSVNEFVRDRSVHRERADRSWHAAGQDRSSRRLDRTWHAAGAFFRDHSQSQHGPRAVPRGDATPKSPASRSAPGGDKPDADATVHSCLSLTDLAEVRGPDVLDRTLMQIETHDDDGYIVDLFNKTTALELWYENRHASLERYVAFLVLFHEMAARVASFAPLTFQVWRSQSQLRVATVSMSSRWRFPFTVSPPVVCEV